MILSAQTIRTECIATPPLITPFNDRTVFEGRSFGLSAAGYDVRIAESVSLTPGVFVLASTIEHFNMPDYLLGYVHDKSSWARQGIAVQNTVIEPGWRGYLTIELTNHGSSWVGIRAGAPIAQIVFHLLDHVTEQPYSGKYQDQEAGPQPMRLEI